MVEAFKKQCGISPLKDILHAPPVEKESDIPQKPFFRRPTRRIDVPFKDQKDRSVTEDSTDQDTQPLDSSNVARSYN